MSVLLRCALISLPMLLAACGGGAASPQGAVAATALPPLHAVRGTTPGIFDAQGRQVLLRGVNYNALGDYYVDQPAFPAPILPKPADFPQMAALGINSVRLLLSWSRVEPQPGQYDEAYLAQVRRQIELAAAQGLYVIVDMHQDAWGKFVATRGTSDVCVAPLEDAIGWDGAPQWATITDGLTTCRIAQREISPAVQAAFTNFYLDTQGIQTRFVAMWQHVVSEVAGYPNVAGYDLFNEPNPGFLLEADAVTYLSTLYTRLVTAIRAAESALPQQPQHIIFFEPDIIWSLVGVTLPTLPVFTNDSNLVFAPHFYCGSGAPSSNAQCFSNAQAVASLYQTTFWVGEWGYFGAPDSISGDVNEFVADQDQALVGAAEWQWAQACGDPHTIGTPGGKPGATVVQLKLIGCPGDVDLGFVQANAQAMSRSYPRAAPGQLQQLSSDVATGEAALSGNGTGTLELWLPERIGKPAISGSGLGAPALQAVPGGFIARIPVSGAYSLQLRRGS
ncbi:MAG: glycosidase [Nevskiaceae bacterium]|nr:MAG: glycosidase [Nevskiaceae bacterium]